MDFKPPSNIDELKKKWEKFTTPEEFCEELQKYLVGVCELNSFAATKGIILIYNTAKNPQTGQEIIARINYEKCFFKPS